MVKPTGIALASVLAAVFVPRPAAAQLPPIAFEWVAAGHHPDPALKLRANGPTDFLEVRVVAQPAGDTGWHTHPGPAVGIVQAGTVTEYHANGCVSVHSKGSVFFERPGEVHRVVNEGSEVAEVYVTFVLPTGTAPFEAADAPASQTCKSDDGDR